MRLDKEKVVIGRDGLNHFLDMWTRMTSKKTVDAAVVVSKSMADKCTNI